MGSLLPKKTENRTIDEELKTTKKSSLKNNNKSRTHEGNSKKLKDTTGETNYDVVDYPLKCETTKTNEEIRADHAANKARLQSKYPNGQLSTKDPWNIFCNRNTDNDCCTELGI